MPEVVGDGPRIKFELEWLGPCPAADPGALQSLAEAVDAMERAGCCPVLDDGKSAGNGAALIDGRLFVSQSGRAPLSSTANDLVEVVEFDPSTWRCRYRSARAQLQPTSDTPLYWAALKQQSGEQAGAKAALHGHVLHTERAAQTLGAPISRRATLFSTHEDYEAFCELLNQSPFPTYRLLIRKEHGFFALSETIGGCRRLVEETAETARRASLLSV